MQRERPLQSKAILLLLQVTNIFVIGFHKLTAVMMQRHQLGCFCSVAPLSLPPSPPYCQRCNHCQDHAEKSAIVGHNNA